MNILWITLESLLPANSGGRLGVYKRLEQVAKTENIYLFYPYDDKSELAYVEGLENLCREVHPYFRGDNKKSAVKMLWRYPYTVGSRMIADLQRDIMACIGKNEIDVINVDFPHMCVNLLGIDTNFPIILNEHNIEWKVYSTIAKSHKNILKRIAYWIDSYRLKTYEKSIIKKLNISKFTFVSDKDMGEMIEDGIVPKEDARLVPVGADVNDTKGSSMAGAGNNIIFVGKMSYGPNIEAAEWFAKEVLPSIRNNVPDATFTIVGKDPTDNITALQCEYIRVTGMVDSVEPFYQEARLVVLPLMNGGGVKVKLLEAVSYKKPIVSTDVGVEGTLYIDGKTVNVANTREEFAQSCIEILTNNGKDRVEAAYKIFKEKYTWESIGKKYVDIIKEACQVKNNA